jgi:hypothetical protein
MTDEPITDDDIVNRCDELRDLIRGLYLAFCGVDHHGGIIGDERDQWSALSTVYAHTIDYLKDLRDEVERRSAKRAL